MILGHVLCGQQQMALELFQQMQQEGVESDSITFVGFLNACSSVVAFEDGWYFHQQIIQSGLESDVFVGNSLVDMHAKCGSINDTSKVFHKMPSQDVVTWNAILEGCAMNGHGKEASSHIWNGCVKKVSSQMISLWLVFCQLVAMQVW
jgi:pentatricopeptide repeat protein